MKLFGLPCLLIITGMITSEDNGVVRLKAKVGEDVVLPCSLGPEVDIKLAVFDWRKGPQDVFLYNAGKYQSGDPQFRGRVSHFPDKLKNGDASIIIRNLQLSDSGYYFCIFQRHQHKTFHVELFVATTTITVKEDDDVILNCSFGATNIENGAFDWKKDVDQSNEDVFWYSGGTTDPGKDFRGRVSHFSDQLRFGNASIKIMKAKTSDSGTYTCYHAIVRKEVKSIMSLTVDPLLKPRPEIEGASPKPLIETVTVACDRVQLQCVVRGAFPKPEVVWMNSARESLQAENSTYDVILNVTVTKTDRYTCVATQKEINHQINSSITVRFSGGASKPLVTNLGDTKDGVLLQCEVFGASPELKVSWKDKSGNLVPSKEPQKTENSIILQTTVKKTDYYRCVITEGKKDDEVYSETHVVVPEESKTKKSSGDGFGVDIIVVTAVVSVLITAVVVGGPAFVLSCCSKSITGGSTPHRDIGMNENQPLQRDNPNNPDDDAD